MVVEWSEQDMKTTQIPACSLDKYLSNIACPGQVLAQAPQAQNMWCFRQLVYIENFMGKSLIITKNCVNNYLI